MQTYQEWLDEFVALRDKSGTPYTRQEYFRTFFNDVDPRKIYEQDVQVTKRLVDRGAIVYD